MDQRIEKFIRRHRLLTLATAAPNGELWVAHVFYVYSDGVLVFTSNPSTKHIAQAIQNPNVAIAIGLESKMIGKLQGVQITGTLDHQQQGDKELYLKRFPFAAPFMDTLWRVQILTAKYTDNTLGFGTKLHYNKDNK